jgi:hypothetical protein
MRNELERMERIEQYLLGRLSLDDKAAFEADMALDPTLREDVEAQRDLMEGADRAAWRQRVRKAGRRFRIRRNTWRWGLPGLGAAVVAAWLFAGHGHGHAGDPSLAADTLLPTQEFTIQADRDTSIITKGGMVVSIPADALGAGSVNVRIHEALTPAAIIESGLSSQSGNGLLESAGMFRIQAFKGGNALEPRKPIFIQVPTDTIKPGMQLYTGVPMPGGRLDWRDPKPLTHDLVPVDIRKLNFYPPHYQDSLKVWGYPTDTVFADSLYFYSGYAAMAGSFTDVGFAIDNNYDKDQGCGIDPSKIRAIRDSAFARTFIATREFERRLHWIFTFERGDILNLYLRNLDKDLCYIDSMAAKFSYGRVRQKFQYFASLREGNVPGPKAHLQDYLWKLIPLLHSLSEKRLSDARDALYQSNLVRATHMNDSLVNAEKRLEAEFKVNYAEVQKQLGIPTVRAASPLVYEANVTSSAWNNIDRLVWKATQDQKSARITDPQTGKQAFIEYDSVNVRISGANQYERIFAYLLPDSIDAYAIMDREGENFGGKQDRFLHYSLVCLAYKGGDRFFYGGRKVPPGPISLEKIDSTDLEGRMASYVNHAQDSSLIKEDQYTIWEIGDSRQRLRYDSLEVVRQKMWNFLYPCALILDRAVETNGLSDTVIGRIDQPPQQ